MQRVFEMLQWRMLGLVVDRIAPAHVRDHQAGDHAGQGRVHAGLQHADPDHHAQQQIGRERTHAATFSTAMIAMAMPAETSAVADSSLV